MVYRSLWSKSAIPHPITKQNMRFKQYNFLWKIPQLACLPDKISLFWLQAAVLLHLILDPSSLTLAPWSLVSGCSATPPARLPALLQPPAAPLEDSSGLKGLRMALFVFFGPNIYFPLQENHIDLCPDLPRSCRQSGINWSTLRNSNTKYLLLILIKRK